ncbi:unnamed protein product, partial [Brassica oleracea var. botrytis]
LPDDLLLNILARVSRLNYRTLSRVSKRFRSIIASPELYQTRSRLNRTEKCLYVCLRFRYDPETYWFALTRLPSRNVANESSGYSVERVSSPNDLLPAQSSTIVAVGSDIYKIGGADHLIVSSTFSFLDCPSHTWREGLNLLMRRNYPFASVLNGKIYAGGSSNSSSFEWMEVFDTKTQTWELVSSPAAEMRARHIHIKRITGIDGKVHILGSSSRLAYDTREGR